MIETTPRQDWNEESRRRYRDSQVADVRGLILRREAEDPSRCPSCGNAEFVRYGRTTKGTERYRCKCCSRTFTPKRPIYDSRVPEEKWMVFAECYVDGLSVRKAADICGISASTAYRMRCRIDEMKSDEAEAAGSVPDDFRMSLRAPHAMWGES